MCNPAVIPYIMAAVAAAGAYGQAQGQKNQAEYQAQVNANNQKVAGWQAEDAAKRGEAAVQATRRKYAALQGTQRASLAARGLDISDGSANAILTDTDFFGDMDQNTVRANAARQAWGYQVQASNFQGNAAALRAQADGINPAMSGVIAGASAYYGYGGKTPKSTTADDSDNSLMNSSSMVDPRWYGSSTRVG